MTIDHAARGVHVSAGPGIVAHLPNITAYAIGDETRLNELLVRLNSLSDAPWREVVRTLTAGIAEADYDDHPHLACVSVSDDRVAALVFGETTLSVTIGGAETTLDGRDSSTWIDVALHGAVDRIHAGHQSDSAIVGVLRDGVVPAGGFLLDTSGPMPASGRWAEVTGTSSSSMPAPVVAKLPEPVMSRQALEAPVDDADARETTDPRPLVGMFARLDERHREDDSAEAIEGIHESHTPELPEAPIEPSDPNQSSIPFPHDEPTNGTNGAAPVSTASEPAPMRPPPPPSTSTLALSRPQLRGILCPEGHLTSVNDVRCRTCGTTTPTDAEIISGDRPILGQLTFDDGAVLAVDRPAAIGSDVPSGYEVAGEPATIVRLDDGLGGVSAVQVEVRLVGWDVEIVDMHSENGTYTILHGERQTRTRLRAGQSVIMQQGMTVETGGRNFTYTIGQAPAAEF